jgi:5-deoxy-glucuronate isomerase
MNAWLVDRFRAGFDLGYTAIVREADGPLDTGLDFGIHVQPAGTRLDARDRKESAWVLLAGRAEVTVDGRTHGVERGSVFDEPPCVVHAAGDTEIGLRALSPRVEWAVARVSNPAAFAPRFFAPGDVASERRGAGLAQEACVRTVRLVFGHAERPESRLVVGEVVCDAGRWSSYPPHHHPQPEIYHYRFTLPQGYGHAELGESVFKVRGHDTLCIPPGRTHAQTAAPGYGMWYLWIVRHLEKAPYHGFETEPQHAWILDPRAQGWRPTGPRS